MPSSTNPLLASPLKTGDTVGFFSASSPVTATAPERFSRGKKFLEEKGFVLKAGSRPAGALCDVDDWRQ